MRKDSKTLSFMACTDINPNKPNPNKAQRKYFKNRSKHCGTNSIISSPSIITSNTYVVGLAFSCLVTMQWDLSCRSPILLLKVFSKREISLDNW